MKKAVGGIIHGLDFKIKSSNIKHYMPLDNLQQLKPGQYCIKCRSKGVKEKVDSANRLFYQCPDCRHKSSRVLEIDSKIKLVKTKEGWKHFTSGALVVDNFSRPQKFLIIKKRKHPYLYDVVAGHIQKNESPQEALIREVKEEVGGDLAQKRPLLHLVINPDPCRRGIDIHEWFLYLCSLKNEVAASKDEVAEINWYPKEELKNLKFVNPTEKMFKMLGLI